MKHLDLFSGIGGFSLAADRVWENVEHTFVEYDPFCQEVLKKHWPEAEIHGDIREFVAMLEGGIIDERLCQDHVAIAGKSREQTTPTGAKNASREQLQSDSTEVPNDMRDTNNECVSQTQELGGNSSKDTVESAHVAGRANNRSSPSTTKMEAGQKRGSKRRHSHSTEKSSDETSQRNTSSFATTATTENTASGNALTKYERPFILTGGFPCQPFSQAGKRAGTADARWLWPEMFRVIQLTKPKWVIAENVSGFTNWDGGMAFETVLANLEAENYEVQAFILPACAVDAPHRRDRVWIIGHAKHDGCVTGEERESSHERSFNNKKGEKKICEFTRPGLSRTFASNALSAGKGKRRQLETTRQRRERRGVRGEEGHDWKTDWFEVASKFCRVDDELSYWVDGRGKKRNSRNPRLKALGNAIVPAVAEQIMRAIRLVDESI